MKRLSTIFGYLVLLAAPPGTMAAPTVQVAPCSNDIELACTTGINGLEVMGMTFDVSFVGGAYDDVFAVNSPFYLGNEAGALAAANAITALLDGLVFGVFVNSPTDSLDEIFIPFADPSPGGFIQNTTSFNDDFPPGTSDWFTDTFSFADRTIEFGEQSCIPDGGDCLWYALFDKQVDQVPEPTTLTLLGLGLAGMGFIRRPRKQ